MPSFSTLTPIRDLVIDGQKQLQAHFDAQGPPGGQEHIDAVEQNAATAREIAAGQGNGYVFPVQGYQGKVSNHWGEVLGGSDLFAPRGTPVRSMSGGTVVSAGWDNTGGNMVLVKGNDGLQYYYAHLDSAPQVAPGQQVQAGTFLGPVGNTGDASGGATHLHIGIGPSIRLGADKYGGTGGDYNAVGLLNSALSGGAPPPMDGNTTTPAIGTSGLQGLPDSASAGATPSPQSSDPANAFMDWVSNGAGAAKDAIGGAASALGTDAHDTGNAFMDWVSQQQAPPPPPSPDSGQPPPDQGQDQGPSTDDTTMGASGPDQAAMAAAQPSTPPTVDPMSGVTAGDVNGIGQAFSKLGSAVSQVVPTPDQLGQAVSDLPKAFPETTKALQDYGSNPLSAAGPIGQAAAGMGVLSGFGTDTRNRLTQDVTGDPNATFEKSALGQSGKVDLPIAGTVPLGGMAAGAVLDPGNLLPGGPASKAEGVAARAAEDLAPKAGELGANMGRKVLDDIGAMFERQANPAREPGGLGKVGQTLERWWLDKYAPINAMGTRAMGEVTAAEKAGNVGADEAMALRRSVDAEAFTGTMAGATQAAKADTVDAFEPIFQQLKGETWGNAPADVQFNKYLKLQTDSDRLQGGPRMSSAGVNSQAQINAAMQELKAEIGPENFAKMQDAEQTLRGVMDDRLQSMVDAGIVKPDVAAALRREYPHYVPVQYTEHLMDEFAGKAPAGGQRMSQTDDLINSLKEAGSPTDTAPPLQSAIQSVFNSNMALRRQAVADVIVNAAKLDPQTTAKLVNTTEPGMAKALAQGRAKESLDIIQGKASPVRVAPSDENTITRFVNGHAETWQVPKDIAIAAKNLDVLQPGPVEKWVSLLNKPLQRFSTTYNPQFLAKNAGADAIQAYIIEGIHPGQIARQYLDAATSGPLSRDLIRSGGAMESYSMRARNPLETGPVSDLMRKARGMSSEQTALANQRRLYGQVAKDSGGVVLDTPQKVAEVAKALLTGEPLRRAGEIVELAPRLATYQKYLDAGMYPERAALMARRVTVDFSRMGTVSKYINAVSPFFNARIQGTANVARAIGQRPDARLRLGVLGALATGAALYNSQFPEYADVPDYMKQSSMIFMLPSTEQNPDGTTKPHYVALPLREWTGFIQPINAAVQKMMGQNPELKDVAWNTFNAFNPVPGETALSGYGGMLPTVAKAPLELMTNKDFYRGGQIVPDPEKNLLPEQQIGPNTSLAAQKIGELTHTSPRMIDFATRDLLGGGGTTALQGASTMMGQPSDKAPVVGNVVSGLYRTGGGQIANTAYDALGSGLSKIQNDNRQLYNSFAASGEIIPPPPGDIFGGKVKLTPAEQLTFQQARVDAINTIFKSDPTFERQVAAMPPDQRKAVLQRVMAMADKQATAAIAGNWSDAEVLKRIQQKAATPPKPYIQPDLSNVRFTAPAA